MSRPEEMVLRIVKRRVVEVRPLKHVVEFFGSDQSSLFGSRPVETN